jgi:hypothetical protein
MNNVWGWEGWTDAEIDDPTAPESWELEDEDYDDEDAA